MTEILPAHYDSAKKKARYLLREGEVVVFPTDTVYGIGADASQRFAVREIFRVKQRPLDKALPVFISEVGDLNLVTNTRAISNQAWLFLQQVWPGALTAILPKSSALLDEVTAGEETVAVRIPDHDFCLDLVRRVGKPLAVTSANLSGHVTPSTASEIAHQLAGQVPLLLDGGSTPQQQPSTIIDFTTTPPRVLRQGALDFGRLKAKLPDLVAAESRP